MASSEARSPNDYPERYMSDDRNTKKPSFPPGYGEKNGSKKKKPTLPPGYDEGEKKKPSLPPGFGSKKKKPSTSKLEGIKSESRGLRGRIVEDLKSEADHFDEAGRQILKFHGIYQQDDRDHRKGGKDYMFMVRSRIPGGRLTAEQYLAHDDLADRYANGTLRVTTRQGFQFHGVVKGDLKDTLGGINDTLLTTLAACGDIARNTMLTPIPATASYHHDIEKVVDALAEHLLPNTRAYHDIWCNGDKVYDGKKEAEVDEPLYGKAYLPRKFKVGVAYPGDNSVDVYTQDVGLIAVAEDDELVGFNVLVGGGLGMTHNKPETYPRLGDLIGFTPVEEVIDVVEKIVTIQRDHGDRVDRRHARMKYLIDDWGLDKFVGELEDRLGHELRPAAEAEPLRNNLYLGWNRQHDGRWFLGLSVENGRIKDDGDVRLKAGLRAAVEKFRPNVRLTPNHDVLLTDLDEADRGDVDALLADYGVAQHFELTNARKYSMACPAMPTCGLAITESERVMPSLMDELELELGRLGLQNEVLSVRMTGCPNGCARPYVADIGFVGRSLDQYTIFLGGRSDGTRLNEPYKDLVSLSQLVPTLRPILQAFKEERRGAESFGDYCARLGSEGLDEREIRYRDYAQAS